MIDRDEALFRAANCTQPGRRGQADSSSRRRARSHLPRENDLGTSAFCAAIPAHATPAAPRAGSTTTRASGPFSTPASGAPSPSVTASRTGTERQWWEPGASAAWRQGGRGGLEYVDKPGPRKRRRRCFLRLYGKCPRRSCHDSCASRVVRDSLVLNSSFWRSGGGGGAGWGGGCSRVGLVGWGGVGWGFVRKGVLARADPLPGGRSKPTPCGLPDR